MNLFENAIAAIQVGVEDFDSLDELLVEASRLRDLGHGKRVSYSRKVFIPLTQLCRDVCHYCTFAQPPRRLKAAYLSPEKVLDIAKKGQQAGCYEALFTLGDKPELRYDIAQKELEHYGYKTTISYLIAMCELVLKETQLLPHVNPGVLTEDDLIRLRQVSISQGIMLENVSSRLCERGKVHYGSPDKNPLLRLETIRQAGILKIPFTTGILIGIGESREERIESLLALRSLHLEYGHIQEIIIQNFRAKPLTKMVHSPEPSLEDLLWTIAMARIIFGPSMNIQAPPNLSPDSYPLLIQAGLNDWGGISPVTKDFVNPEAPWPLIQTLTEVTKDAGKILLPRLASYPQYCQEASKWHDAHLTPRILSLVDSMGYVRVDHWSPGLKLALDEEAKIKTTNALTHIDPGIESILEKIPQKIALEEAEIVHLFQARGDDFHRLCQFADNLRREVSGDIVRFVVNRNINYTNVCYYKCQFCAFSKGKLSENLRGTPYDLELSEIARRVKEAWERGATEVCLQGGIHPAYTGETYLNICRTIKEAVPKMHIHAFSPLEVWQGAKTLGLSLETYLKRLKDAGLNTLPGTAAEILDDEVRAVLCPDKINTHQWLEVMETAHSIGFRTTSTIMFGHIDSPVHWARHLLRVRHLQQKTQGFTEFVPLPFIHMEAPLYLRGKARKGPTLREVILMHAVARIVLHPWITNIQVSWVKLGKDAVKLCLQAGANDLGGTLMNESISRAAGTMHGQENPPWQMEEWISGIQRTPQQRTTLYQQVSDERYTKAHQAAPLQPVTSTKATKYTRK